MQEYLPKITEKIFLFLPTVAMGIVLLVFGWFIINMVLRLVQNVMTRRNIDNTITPYITSLLNVLLKAVLLLSVASFMGIKTASFLVILSAASLTMGLALQGSLSNFAGGMLVLVFKPVKVGDYIAASGHEGVVKEIQIFNTYLTSLDNKTIVIPNAKLSNEVIVNYTMEDYRRADFIFSIDYDDDIMQARKLILAQIETCDKVLQDKKPQVIVNELADSSVNLMARLWCKNENIPAIKFYLNEAVKNAFDQSGINIPFPQQVMRVHPNTEESKSK